jgi:excisionase family DNA binding protein
MQLLTAKEAAAFLKIHQDTVKKYYRAGELKGFKVGNRVRFSTIDISDFIQRKYQQEGIRCCTEEKTQAIGGLRSLTMEKQYREALGLTTKS